MYHEINDLFNKLKKVSTIIDNALNDVCPQQREKTLLLGMYCVLTAQDSVREEDKGRAVRAFADALPEIEGMLKTLDIRPR